MEKVSTVSGVAVQFLSENIDTDAIIPAPWLRSLDSDLGKGLFARSRYKSDGSEEPGFVLNQAPFRDSRILIGGANFGCGSSREGAVWAIMGFGIRCVIAPSFGDIFYENSFKNGLLLIILPPETIAELSASLERSNEPTLTVDLAASEIRTADGKSVAFAIPAARRTALLDGLDEIGMTLQHEAEIADFQTQDREARPWVHSRAPWATRRAS